MAGARETLYDRTPTRVLRAEHLVAIALQTGREKGHERARVLKEQAPPDRAYLAAILARRGLEDT
jgi:hypothetical protein